MNAIAKRFKQMGMFRKYLFYCRLVGTNDNDALSECSRRYLVNGVEFNQSESRAKKWPFDPKCKLMREKGYSSTTIHYFNLSTQLLIEKEPFPITIVQAAPQPSLHHVINVNKASQDKQLFFYNPSEIQSKKQQPSETR